jgi:RNA polymerase sigma-70 factor (ECF subfamily)
VKPKDGWVQADAARFRSTHWSIVLTAAQDQTPAGQAALAELYRTYWYPLYSYVRRRGYSPQDSQDLTQGFFLHLLEHRGLTQVDQHKGKFRSFLLASLQNFFSVAQHREHTIKRGGRWTFISLDAETAESRYRLEPVDDLALTAEQIFDARWALALLNETLTSVQAQYAAHGKEKTFETLKGFIARGSTPELSSYQAAAAALGISEAAVTTLIYRLRQQYSLALRREVARTVPDPSTIDEELHFLCEALVAAEGYLAQ